MKYLIFIALLHFSFLAFSQADSVKIQKRQRICLITGTTAIYGMSVIGMNELWYKNYQRSSFHWVDDSGEWKQTDKAGHFFTSYFLARTFSEGLEAVGVNHNKSTIYALGVSVLGISTIEVFDGFSAGWGASSTDLLANVSGAMLFAAQSLTWSEEKIIPKFSWHPSVYAAYRPEVLGRNFPEHLLKDYNGQTYWLSINMSSVSGIKCLPPWLCLSLGYGAEGMISGYNNKDISPYFKPYRQYYLSLDADLNKIITRNNTLNTILHYLNFIKVPFPALIFSEEGTKFHGLYF